MSKKLLQRCIIYSSKRGYHFYRQDSDGIGVIKMIESTRRDAKNRIIKM